MARLTELRQKQQRDSNDAEGRRDKRARGKGRAECEAHADRVHEYDGREEHRHKTGCDVLLRPVHAHVVEREQRRTEHREPCMHAQRKAQRAPGE